MSAPSDIHELLVERLVTLADLMGFTLRSARALPDGSRPDVLRRDYWRRRLFVGDAKATEWPDGEAWRRITGYASWLEAYSLAGGPGLLLIATPSSDMAGAWSEALATLPLAAAATPRRSHVDRSLYVVGLASGPYHGAARPVAA
jgi:hypothetical protein